MVKVGIVCALVWASGLVLASPNPAPLVAVRTTNFPGTSDEDTIHAVWRRLAALAHREPEPVFRNSTSISKSWNDATLFSYTRTAEANTSAGALEAGVSIDVTCVTCYFTADVTAELTINGTFDLGKTLSNVTDQIGDELKNLTKTAADSIGHVVKNFFEQVGEQVGNFFAGDEFEIDELVSFDDFDVDTDIDVDLPPLPEVQLLFQLDTLDLYMEIDTTIAAGATLTIPLYRSATAAGLWAGDDMEAGLFVTMDLILSVEGEITLRSGFHLLLDDPIGFNIALFGSDVSSIIFNGGKFEFLPVTVISGSVALKAILRIGMHAGFSISSDPIEGIPEKFLPNATVKAGVEVGVFATVAEFLTNITGGANLKAQEGCALKIVEEYTLALGAVAGATLAVGEHTWGPTPNTTIPVYYTTLADVCAVTATPKPTPATTTALAPRQAADPKLDTQTITTKVFYTGVACSNPAEFNCPRSQQTTSLLTSTLTLVTAVPSGVKATFPASTALAVPTTIPFGKQANALSATTGVPVSYVPPPPPPPPTSSATTSAGGGDILDDVGKVFDGETGGVSNKLIIGLSVGLGVPFLAAVIGGLVQWLRRRRYTPVPKSDTVVEYAGGYQSPMAAEREGMIKKSPAVSVGEAH